MKPQYLALPSSWQTTRVDRVARVSARIGWKALTAAEYQPDGYAFLATPNIKGRDIDFENVNYISEFRYNESPELKLEIGDVLLAKDGNTLGITNIVRTLPRPATVNGSIAVLRPTGIHGPYLMYALASTSTQQAIQAIKGGMGVPHLFQWDINRLPIPLPPMEEQRRIADFLDAETTRLDRLVTARQRQMEALSERTLATVTEAFLRLEGAIDIRLGYLTRVQSGLTVDGGRDVTGDVVTRPYLRVANVQNGYLDLENVTEITVPRRLAAGATLRRGDVLMTEGGDPDKLGRGTVWNGQLPGCLHQNHVFAVRPDPAKLVPDYLALYTRSVPARMHFERTGTKTTNLASTSSSKIKDLRVPVVPLNVQTKLCERVTIELATVERLTSAVSAQVELIAERRQALVSAAVTGQFDVTTGRGVELS